MTPDEVHALLNRLPCPMPSPELRDRVLGEICRRLTKTGRSSRFRPRHAAVWGSVALAGSLAVFGGILWIIIPHKASNQVDSRDISSDPGIGHNQDARPSDPLPFQQVWESARTGAGVLDMATSESLVLWESRDFQVFAADRTTGKAAWSFAINNGSTLDWGPVAAEGVPEEIGDLEATLRQISRQIDNLLKDKVVGAEMQALQKRGSEVRERLRGASAGDNIFVVSEKGLYCFDRLSAAHRWHRSLGFVPSARPLAIRGYVFLADGAGRRVRVLDVEKQGIEVASYAGAVVGGLAYADPFVCFACDDGNVCCYKVTDGTLTWTYALQGKVVTPPAVQVIRRANAAGAGQPWVMRVLFVSAGRTLHALDLDAGNLVWKSDCGAEITSPPIRKDDTLYVKTGERALIAFELLPEAGGRIGSVGRSRWKLPGGERFILKGRDLVYVLGENQQLIAVSESTGEVKARYAVGNYSHIATNLTDGLLYAAGPGNRVTCLAEAP